MCWKIVESISRRTNEATGGVLVARWGLPTWSLTTKLSNYFSTFEILDGIKCNGSLCKSEIGADFFGLNVILKLAKGYKDFDYKLLFKTIAENNFYTTSEQIIRINHIKDFHPPNYLRVNAIVQQFDEFYEAYNIKWWDGMYLAPKKRIRLGK